MSSCDTFDPTAVVPQERSLEVPSSPHAESFISPEAIAEPSQLTAGKLFKPSLSVTSYSINKQYIIRSFLVAYSTYR
jgi:hypothetical protein